VIPTGLSFVVDYQSFKCCFLNGVTKVVQHFLGFERALGAFFVVNDNRRAEPAALGRVQPKAATGSAVYKI